MPRQAEKDIRLKKRVLIGTCTGIIARIPVDDVLQEQAIYWCNLLDHRSRLNEADRVAMRKDAIEQLTRLSTPRKSSFSKATPRADFAGVEPMILNLNLKRSGQQERIDSRLVPWVLKPNDCKAMSDLVYQDAIIPWENRVPDGVSIP